MYEIKQLPGLVLLFCLCFPLAGWGQYRVSGRVHDTLTFRPAGQGIVMLRSVADGEEWTTSADEEGYYALVLPGPGKYVLTYGHQAFFPYADTFLLQSALSLDIYPRSKDSLLNEVVIRDRPAMMLKGDTFLFQADSFRTRLYSGVDELLKQLPGIELDAGGRLTAYGKPVTSLLVDGTPYFSQDPARLMQLLRAGQVDRVAVYDRKDPARPGAADAKEKIINLSLKGEAKQGFFGKAALGAGLPEVWEAGGDISAFRDRRKITFYLQGGNALRGNDDVPGEVQQGIPDVRGAGLHYDNKWLKDDRLSLSADYTAGSNNVRLNNGSLVQKMLPDTVYFTKTSSSGTNHGFNHNLQLNTQYNIDPTATLTLNVHAEQGQAEQEQQSTSRSVSGQALNESAVYLAARNRQQILSADMMYTKSFRKNGRLLTLEWSASENRQQNEQTVRSAYTLDGGADTTRTNQYKQSANVQHWYAVKLICQEPLTPYLSLSLNGSLNSNRSRNRSSAYDQTEAQPVYDPAYSSDYFYAASQYEAGGDIQLAIGKTSLSLGSSIVRSVAAQEDHLLTRNNGYQYTTFVPRFSVRSAWKWSGSLNLSYSGHNVQPEQEQVQALINNNNPLELFKGNPELRQEFDHLLSVEYSHVNQQATRIFNLGVSGTLAQHAISAAREVDASGAAQNSYVNLDGNYGLSVYALLSQKLNSRFRADLNCTAGYDRKHTLLNGTPSPFVSWKYAPGLAISYTLDTLLRLKYSVGGSWNATEQGIVAVRQNYSSLRQVLLAEGAVSGRITAALSVAWDLRQGLQQDDPTASRVWCNARASVFLTASKALCLTASVQNILDQKLGFIRTVANGNIYESVYAVRGRYCLLSLVWHFTYRRQHGGM